MSNRALADYTEERVVSQIYGLLPSGSSSSSSSGGTGGTVAGLRIYPAVTSITGSSASLEAIAGADVNDGDKVLIDPLDGAGNWVASSWRVFKPATEITNVADGIVRLLDNSAHLVRTGGF